MNIFKTHTVEKWASTVWVEKLFPPSAIRLHFAPEFFWLSLNIRNYFNTGTLEYRAIFPLDLRNTFVCFWMNEMFLWKEINL